MPRTDVSDNRGASRYELHLDGELAGVVLYRAEGATLVIPHIEVRPELRGKGYGRELVRALCEYGFGRIGLNCLYLNVFTFNEAAIATYRACGFAQIGLEEGACRYEGETWDLARMELHVEDFG